MNQKHLRSLGKTLRSLRDKNDLAQKEVIQRSGEMFTERTLRDYENGSRRPSRDRLLRMLVRSFAVTNSVEINRILQLAGYTKLTDEDIPQQAITTAPGRLEPQTQTIEPDLPADVRVEMSTIISVDPQGRELWRHRFPSRLIQAAYQDEHAGRRFNVTDIDGDGRVETLFVYTPVDYGSVGTTLLCFGQDGQINWQFEPGKTVRDSTGRMYDPPYFISNVRLLRIPGFGIRILVSSNHHLYNPNQIAILSPTGQLISEYWHSGHLLWVAQADLNEDGIEEVLLGGVNNGYHQATMVVFDPRNISGASAQPGRQILGFPEGTEKAILLFPKTCLAQHAPYNRVMDVRVTRERRIVVVTAEGIAETQNPGVMIYQLDFDLNVLSARPDSRLQESHRLLEVQGHLDHHWTEEESERLRTQVVVQSTSAGGEAAPGSKFDISSSP